MTDQIPETSAELRDQMRTELRELKALVQELSVENDMLKRNSKRQEQMIKDLKQDKVDAYWRGYDRR